MDSKVCSKCGIEKSIEEFSFWSRAANIRRPECKECSKLAGKNISEEQRLERNRKQRERKLKNPEKVNAIANASYKRTTEGKVKRRLEQPEDPATKICTRCLMAKPIDEFVFFNKAQNIRRPECKECRSLMRRNDAYRVKNNARQRQKRQLNPETVRAKEKDTRRRRFERDPDKVRTQRRAQQKKHQPKTSAKNKARRKNEPQYALMKDVVATVNHILSGGTEHWRSLTPLFFEKVGYTKEELFTHIESLFEDWMNWSNRGRYVAKDWNDDDTSTFKWHLDHIMPRKDLPYDSFDHPNFKKCWALSNLRPLNAKQNVIDGARRTRHQKDQGAEA